MQISHEIYDRRSAGFPGGSKRYAKIVIRPSEGDDLSDTNAERYLALPLAGEGGRWKLVGRTVRGFGNDLEGDEHELVLEQIDVEPAPLDHGEFLRSKGLALPKAKGARRIKQHQLQRDLEGHTARVADATKEFDSLMRVRVEALRPFAAKLLGHVRGKRGEVPEV